MNSAIPTLEELAQRLQSNAIDTIDGLESQAKLESRLAVLHRNHGTLTRRLEVSLEESEEINATTVRERDTQRQRLIMESIDTILSLDSIADNSALLVKTKADIAALHMERGVLGQLLRIREMADTAERAAQRQGWQRSPWQRRWRQ